MEYKGIPVIWPPKCRSLTLVNLTTVSGYLSFVRIPVNSDTSVGDLVGANPS